MAVSSGTELKIKVKVDGEKNLDRLSRQLGNIGKDTVSAEFKFDKFTASLRKQQQEATKSVSNLRTFAGAWRELANSVDYTSAQFREANREAQRLERQLAKTQQAGRGGGLARAARTGGAIAAAGIFGGPEGAIGAGIGAFGGPVGAAVGGAIGAQVGQFRQQLGGTASYAAELQKQRLALQLVTKDADEYQRALKFISTTSKELAIPQDILTRQFTKLSASVIGAGGDVNETEKAFKGITAGIRGTGGSLQDLDSALTATAQVFSKGKVSAEELRQQIGERLPGAFTLFAESLGMTPQELDKALEQGQVSLQDFQKFAEKLFNEYGASAKIIADSPAAAGDRLETALKNLSASVGTLLQPIGAAFQTTFAEIANAIAGAANALNEFFGIAGGAKLRKLNEVINKEVESLTALKGERTARLAGLTMTERAKGQVPDLTFLNRKIREGEARLQKFTDEYYSLQAVTRAVTSGDRRKPKGLPSIVPADSSAKGKGAPDYSVQLANALIAAQNELNPIKKIQLEYDAEILKIEESKLKPEKKRVALNAANVKLNEQSLKLGNQMAAGNAALFLKDIERNNQIKETIQNLEIEAGIIDEATRLEIERTRLINELQAGGRNLTEQELKRIDDAQARINQKTSETTKLLQQIGQNVITSIGDAFESLLTKAQSLRDIFADLLRQTARLFLNFGLQAGAKALFPKLFPQAMGGIMTGNGPLPLKKYAKGGIAYGPQMALFGEGSRPEAYVPLPDGRTIPVTMKGGADVGNIVVNVDATGSSVEGDGVRGDKLGEALGAAVRAELIRQKRPGGLLG